jgi:TolB protein
VRNVRRLGAIVLLAAALTVVGLRTPVPKETVRTVRSVSEQGPTAEQRTTTTSLPRVTTSTSTTTTTTIWTTASPVVAATAVGCDSSHRPAPETNGRIVFTGKAGISTMRADGSDVRLFKADAEFGAWSPDGTQLAFNNTFAPSGRARVVVASFERPADERTLADDDHFLLPRWSPDGSHLALRTSRGLAVVDAAGSNRVYVPNTDYRAAYPRWAPDCQTLVYEQQEEDGPSVYRIDIDGTHRTRLSSDGPAYDTQPSWSPDGAHIAFARRLSDQETAIFVMAPDGTDVRQLTSEPGWHGYPSWSPDGTMIAYAGQAYIDGEWRAPIHVMRADGTDRHHIGPYDSPAWAPDWGTTAG